MAPEVKGIARALGAKRGRIAALRLLCERTALRLSRPGRRRFGGRILCYHSVGQPDLGVNDVTPAQFRRHIELALASGRRFVPASRIADGQGAADELAVTFDDGARSVLTAAEPILRHHAIPFTVFVVARWAEEARENSWLLGWKELERLLSFGAEIGSHSLTHPDFGRIDSARAAVELGVSRALIRTRLGVRCDDFAIPYGITTKWPSEAARLAAKAGYVRAYAQSEDLRPPETTPRSFVTRFDGDANFKALLSGAYDGWQEWC